jgi:hypothetical protein
LHNGLSLPVTPSPRNRHDRGVLSRSIGPLLDWHPSTLHYATPKRKLDSRQVSSEDGSR